MNNPFDLYALTSMCNLQQPSIVDLYYSYFDFLMMCIWYIFPGICNAYFLSSFINGLKPTIQIHVLQHHPCNMLDAYELALIREFDLQSVQNASIDPSTSSPQVYDRFPVLEDIVVVDNSLVIPESTIVVDHNVEGEILILDYKESSHDTHHSPVYNSPSMADQHLLVQSKILLHAGRVLGTRHVDMVPHDPLGALTLRGVQFFQSVPIIPLWFASAMDHYDVTSLRVNYYTSVPVVASLIGKDAFKKAPPLLKVATTLNISHIVTAPCILKASIFVLANISKLFSISSLARMVGDFAIQYGDFHQVLDKGGTTTLAAVYQKISSPTTLPEVVPSGIQVSQRMFNIIFKTRVVLWWIFSIIVLLTPWSFIRTTLSLPGLS